MMQNVNMILLLVCVCGTEAHSLGRQSWGSKAWPFKVGQQLWPSKPVRLTSWPLRNEFGFHKPSHLVAKGAMSRRTIVQANEEESIANGTKAYDWNTGQKPRNPSPPESSADKISAQAPEQTLDKGNPGGSIVAVVSTALTLGITLIYVLLPYLLPALLPDNLSDIDPNAPPKSNSFFAVSAGNLTVMVCIALLGFLFVGSGVALAWARCRCRASTVNKQPLLATTIGRPIQHDAFA
eukprot:gnl/MRDRNA2_/MRDRNA2_55694_c0_seq1.p1 gnl/MRDRNA2_/MRDRNA2_55694_c0~~gnl/MRDRNA2_/MRDRNA2_55694_c0_seq1.p1  ORF type:complete len:237 (-),score=25.56 gnl/MRDRNA2_/MRDRNA2_55694_c0_seq1:290-1000(-)